MAIASAINPVNPGPSEDESAPIPPPTRAWSKFRASELIIIAGLMVLVALLTIPKLPSGICYDDAGDIQLASATLGIEHPPGYAGYVTMGYLLTRLIPVDPAYVISLACLAAGLIALLVCVLMQIRLGADVWLACAIGALLVWHPRFWLNLRAPEVYMPTLALLSVAAYLLVRYARIGKRRDLFLAALAFGAAMANRPPVLFAAPFFVAGWWIARRAWEPAARPAFRTLTVVAVLAALPCVYAFGYVVVRDRPDACYNYLDNHNETTNVLPPSTDGFEARLHRAWWHLSGQQFNEYKGDSWRGMVGKWRWIRSQLNYGAPITDAMVFVCSSLGIEPPVSPWFVNADVLMLVILASIGLYIAFRRCPATGWLLVGFVVHVLLFVSVYRVYGQAADLLPLVFAGAVLLGVAGSKLFPARGTPVRRIGACVLAVLAAILLIRDLPGRASGASGVDATDFVRELDLATFPKDAVIIANWTKSVPLRYAQCVLHGRGDLHVVTADPEVWIDVARSYPDRPIFVSDPVKPLGSCEREPFRNLYRLTCPSSDSPFSVDR